jgi:hypothetical protein
MAAVFIVVVLLAMIAMVSRNVGRRRPPPSRFHLFWTRGDYLELPKRWRKRRGSNSSQPPTD